MEWRDLVVDDYQRIQNVLETALKEGLQPGDLDRLPRPDCNSMGWLAWHTARIHDHENANLMGEEQLWIKDGWHQKFNRPADPSDTGNRHTPEQVAAFRSPDIKVLLDYHRAVLERTKKYLLSLTPEGLGSELNEPRYQPLPTVGVRLVSVISDCLQHAGQISYVRGLLKGKGWLGY